MKRAPEDADGPPVDPVLAQLDALINGTAPPPPAKAVRTEAAVAQDPVLAQLDALINPGASAALLADVAAPREERERAPPLRPPPPVHFATPVALVLPEPAPAPEPRGPPGLLREFGGVKAWMLLRANAEEAAPGAGR